MISNKKLATAILYTVYFYSTVMTFEAQAKREQPSEVNARGDHASNHSRRCRQDQNERRDRNPSDENDAYKDYNALRNRIISKYEHEQPGMSQYRRNGPPRRRAEGLESNSRHLRDNTVALNQRLEKRNERLDRIEDRLLEDVEYVALSAVKMVTETKISDVSSSNASSSILQVLKGLVGL